VDGAKKKLNFVYDWRARRRSKIVSTWNGSAFNPASTNRFVYDDWNLIAEVGATNNLIRSYLWGMDLSGTMQGAGGVGGLAAVNVLNTGVHFPAYDGNGNVSALVKGTDGTISAQYEYGAFGELIRSSGTAAASNPCRFSTKWTDDESDFLYYGYRLYNSSSGRWLNRDPIGEAGGVNLYGFINDSPLAGIDAIGLCQCKCKKVKGGPVSDRVYPGGPLGTTIRLTLIVPWQVEVTGDASKCHCRYIDDGSITATFFFRSQQIQEKTKSFPYVVTPLQPCESFQDYPGVYEIPPNWPDFSYSLRFNIKVTYECQDEDYSNTISDTVNVNGLYISIRQ